MAATTTAGWHASPELLTAYAAGNAGPVDAWSLEAHVVVCPACRAELASSVQASSPPPVRHALAAGREHVAALVAAAPGPVRGSAARRARGAAAGLSRTGRRGRTGWASRRPLHRHLRWAVRPAALAAVLAAVAGAVLLTVASAAVADGSAPGTGALLWLLAPAIPLAGVSLGSMGETDPWREVVLSTPTWGLGLVLRRTLAVLTLALPLSAGAGLLLRELGPASAAGSWPLLWLLPCLALTVLTLALGTVVGLERAAAGVAGSWLLAVLGPVLVRSGLDLGVAADRLAGATPVEVPVVAGVIAQTGWAGLALAAAVVLLRRARCYQQLAVSPP